MSLLCFTRWLLVERWQYGETDLHCYQMVVIFVYRIEMELPKNFCQSNQRIVLLWSCYKKVAAKKYFNLVDGISIETYVYTLCL